MVTRVVDNIAGGHCVHCRKLAALFAFFDDSGPAFYCHFHGGFIANYVATAFRSIS